MIYFDFWYGDTLKDVTSADVAFYPNNAEYRGNLYKGNECIGDFSANDSVKLEKALPGIFD